MTQDRNYWRSSETRALIEAARDSGNELAIALGERLDALTDVERELDTLEQEHRDLTRQHVDLQQEHHVLRCASAISALAW